MNAKLLFAATVAISLVSTLALADEATQPLTRAQVVGELNQAAATGTLRRTDYDFDTFHGTTSTRTRAQVEAEAVAQNSPSLVGPLGNRDYNQFGLAAVARSTMTRAEVKSDLDRAIADGTLRRTDYDVDGVLVARRAAEHVRGEQLYARHHAASIGQAG